MNGRLKIPAILACLFCALVASRTPAATVNVVGGLGSATVFSESDMTFVDISRSATGTDTYSTATVYWAGGSSNCAGSFMLKFYHPDPATGESLTYLDERGPFNASPGLEEYNLSPAVSLSKGDLVGITELSSGDCGAVELLVGGGNETLAFIGDSGTSNITLCDQSLASLIPQSIGVLVRSTGTENRAGVVLGAGSAQGAAGSNFKTSMQLSDPGSVSIRGRLVFHALGQAGQSTDPSLPYTLNSGQVLSFPDIVSAIGGSGLGSIDVIADSSYAPLVVTRIFNDGGAAGTAGFSEPLVRLNDQYVINSGDSAFLLAPSDFSKFRMNVAIRSLADGATVELTVLSPNGPTIADITKTYPPDEFDLESTAQLFPGVSIPANALLRVRVSAGRAVVGGVTVDNTTNDTGLQLGTRTHF